MLLCSVESCLSLCLKHIKADFGARWVTVVRCWWAPQSILNRKPSTWSGPCLIIQSRTRRHYRHWLGRWRFTGLKEWGDGFLVFEMAADFFTHLTVIKSKSTTVLLIRVITVKREASVFQCSWATSTRLPGRSTGPALQWHSSMTLSLSLETEIVHGLHIYPLEAHGHSSRGSLHFFLLALVFWVDHSFVFWTLKGGSSWWWTKISSIAHLSTRVRPFKGEVTGLEKVVGVVGVVVLLRQTICALASVVCERILSKVIRNHTNITMGQFINPPSKALMIQLSFRVVKPSASLFHPNCLWAVSN